ncbi:MAG: hypothetical protein ACRDRG_07555 [Pseudonocardiaceae bacterium]
MGRRWGTGLIALLMIVATGCSTASDTGAPQLIVGDWAGRIEPRGDPLDFGIRFTAADRGLAGTMDVPAQGVSALALGDVRVESRNVTFAVPEVAGNATFRGTLVGSGDTATVRGDFTQGARRVRRRRDHGRLYRRHDFPGRAGRHQPDESSYTYVHVKVTY